MKLFNKKIWEVVFVSSTAVLCLGKAVYDAASANPNQVNDFFGIQQTTASSGYFGRDYENADEVKAYCQEVGREVQQEGTVLLKNENNALPLSKGEKVSLFFNGSGRFNYATSGSSAADTSNYKNLNQALTDAGLSVNKTLWDFTSSESFTKEYRRYLRGQNYKISEAPYSAYSDDVKKTFAEYKTAIFTISRDSGEGKDINARNADTIDGSYLTLSQEELDMLKEMTKLKNEGTIGKIVVLLNSSQGIQLDFLSDPDVDVDACLFVGNVGTYGIDGMADVLVGNVNPSGRLSDTLLKDNFSSPAMASWVLNTGMSYSQVYDNSKDLHATQQYYGVNLEGIYVGYRYYETRYYDSVMKATGVGDYDYDDVVAYPFGYGLSYTDFSYSDYKVTEDDNGDFAVTLKVTNEGKTAGKEVVQIYLSKPYTDYDKKNGIEKSAVELVGFDKTEILAPKGEEGDSQEVTITIPREKMKSYDANGAKTYIVDEGDYSLVLGKDSHDATNNLLASKGKGNVGGESAFVYTFHQDELDTKTYSTSTHTGKPITNLFDESDINRYSHRGDNKVTYVSRSNWEKTFPTASVTLTINDEMKKDLAPNRSYTETETALPTYGAEQKWRLAQLRSTEKNPIPYDDERWDELLDQMSFADQSLLITSASFSTVALPSVSKPVTAEDDGPTGVSHTKTGTSFSSEGIWACTFNVELIEKVGDALAEDCIEAGKTGLFAGGVNIHRTPFGGRNHEYFSEDPFLSGEAGKAEVIGLQKKGVIAHVKHLAFNEMESNRNGIGIWLSEQEAREILLAPFEACLAIDEGNSHGVMSSFNRIGTIWAGGHDNLQNALIRGEWGFDGYAITDMADSNGAFYMTYQDGILNGTDCYLGGGSESALNAFRNSPTFAHRMRESCHRILYAVGNFSRAMNGYGENDDVKVEMPWWQTTLIAVDSVLAAISLASIGLYVTSLILEKKRQ